MKLTLDLPDDPPIADLVKCVERELRMRDRVYPGLVQRGKMSGREAQREKEEMRAVLTVLRQIAAAAPKPPERQTGLPGVGPSFPGRA